MSDAVTLTIGLKAATVRIRRARKDNRVALRMRTAVVVSRVEAATDQLEAAYRQVVGALDQMREIEKNHEAR